MSDIAVLAHPLFVGFADVSDILVVVRDDERADAG
jgi:hypothetical protein